MNFRKVGKATARKEYVSNVSDKVLKSDVYDALILASTHDPDHSKILDDLKDRVELIEHVLQRIGAPQYRTKKLKNGAVLRIERVRGVSKGDYKLNVGA